jgi:hypothetical protein
VARRRPDSPSFLFRPLASVHSGTAPWRRPGRAEWRERARPCGRPRVVRGDRPDRGQDRLDRNAGGLHGDARPSRLDRGRKGRPRRGRRSGRNGRAEWRGRPSGSVRLLRAAPDRPGPGLRRPAGISAGEAGRLASLGRAARAAGGPGGSARRRSRVRGCAARAAAAVGLAGSRASTDLLRDRRPTRSGRDGHTNPRGACGASARRARPRLERTRHTRGCRSCPRSAPSRAPVDAGFCGRRAPAGHARRHQRVPFAALAHRSGHARARRSPRLPRAPQKAGRRPTYHGWR